MAVASRTAVPSAGTTKGDLLALHRHYAATGDPETRRALIEAHSGLAQALARRIGSRGADSVDDMVQVAYLALMKAVDRFDPDLGYQFSTYATRVITGELKRHLRDYSWSVRPPRAIHDLYLAAESAADDLTQELRRNPTVAEVAERLGVDEESVLEAGEAGFWRRTPSLDRPSATGDTDVGDIVGAPDDGFARLEGRLLLEALLPKLDDQARRILDMRFNDRLSQAEIASRLGTSQMNVSRTLRRTLDRLLAAADGR